MSNFTSLLILPSGDICASQVSMLIKSPQPEKFTHVKEHCKVSAVLFFKLTSLSHSNSSSGVIGSACFTFVPSPLDRRNFILAAKVFLKSANLKSKKKLMSCPLNTSIIHRPDNKPTLVDIHFRPFYECHIQTASMNSSSLRHPCAEGRVRLIQVTHSCFSLGASFRKHQMPNACFSLYFYFLDLKLKVWSKIFDMSFR